MGHGKCCDIPNFAFQLSQRTQMPSHGRGNKEEVKDSLYWAGHVLSLGVTFYRWPRGRVVSLYFSLCLSSPLIKLNSLFR